MPDAGLPKIFIKKNHIYFYDEVNAISAFFLKGAIEQAVEYVKTLATEFMSQEPLPVYLHIQSNGGDPYAGLFLYDVIKENQDYIHVIGEGMVASAATLFFIAAIKRSVTPNTFFLIHQGTGGLYGYRDINFMDSGENARSLQSRVIDLYAKESAASKEELKELLLHDYYKPAEWLLEKGFISNIEGEEYDPKIDKSPLKKVLEDQCAVLGITLDEYLNGCVCEECEEEKKDAKAEKTGHDKTKSKRGTGKSAK